MVDSTVGKMHREAPLNSDWPAELFSHHTPASPYRLKRMGKTKTELGMDGRRISQVEY